MKRFKKNLILLLAISLSIIFLVQCSKYKEPAPFFDGLVLEYDLGGHFKWIYNVQTLDNNRFKIIKTDKRGAIGDTTYELYSDVHGRVYSSSSKTYEGKFSPIWLPVHEMKIGDTFDGGYTVTREEKWKKWKVLVVKNPKGDVEQYYEVNTGYWVGYYGKGGKRFLTIVLVNTNADIPVAE